MKKKLMYLLLSGLISNVYSIDKIEICTTEKLYGNEYQNTDLSTLKFEKVKKLTFKGKGCFDNSKKLKKVVFDNENIEISIPSGAIKIPMLLDPNKDLGLPFDCHVMLQSDIDMSAQKINRYRELINKCATPNELIANFTRSLKNSINKHKLDCNNIDNFSLEIIFYVVNECSEHNDWYLVLTEKSYKAVSYISEKSASYGNVTGTNVIDGEVDMADFYRSDEYKFALSIYEFLSAISTVDSGNIYERTLNMIINNTQDQYTISMCNALKGAYKFVEKLNTGIGNLEKQVYDQQIQKQRMQKEEITCANEQKLRKKNEKQRKFAEKQEAIRKRESQKNALLEQESIRRKREYQNNPLSMKEACNLMIHNEVDEEYANELSAIMSKENIKYMHKNAYQLRLFLGVIDKCIDYTADRKISKELAKRKLSKEELAIKKEECKNALLAISLMGNLALSTLNGQLNATYAKNQIMKLFMDCSDVIHEYFPDIIDFDDHNGCAVIHMQVADIIVSNDSVQILKSSK